MDNRRFFLFLLLSLLALQVYFALVTPPRPPETSTTELVPAAPSTGELSSGGLVAPAEGELSDLPASHASEEFAPLAPIIVETGVYRVEFTNRGARPQRWDLTDPVYSNVAGEGTVLQREQAETGPPPMIPQPPADAGLDAGELPLEVELAGWPRTLDFNRVNWQLVEPPAEDPQTGAIRLAFESPDRGGLVLRKEFTFHRPPADGSMGDQAGGYLTDFRLVLRNAGSQRITLNDAAVGLRLTWGPGIGPYEPTGFYGTRTPLVLADGDTWYSTPGAGESTQIATSDPDGIRWAGLQSRYFMAAVIPAGEARPVVSKVTAELRPENLPRGDRWSSHSPLHTVALEHGAINLAPGEELAATYQLYVGPKHRPHLLAAGFDLQRAEHAASWFWMRGLMVVMLHTLNVFHGLTGNFGVAILLLTVIIRLLLYPLTHHQMQVMAKTQREMARIKPFLDEVREKHRGDPAKIQRETMAVYREHGVNPFAGLKGCLPLLLQMPIFFALFLMLRSSVELRGQGWLWIDDLSAPDALIYAPWLEGIPLIGWLLGPSINLLPILMAVTQWGSMKLSATQITDPNQRFMMNFMPLMLTVMLFRAPSGLMVYWVASNVWQMGQQYLITRSVQRHAEEAEAAPAAAAPGGKPAAAVKAPVRKSAKASLNERRREAAKARQRAMAESSSLPRWARRGSR